MLLACEAASPHEAIAMYAKAEKNPVLLPPRNLRFTRNPRSVLYLHLCLGQSSEHAQLLTKALSLFLSQATRWEKGVQPLPYVAITEAARVVRACLETKSGPPEIGDVVALIK